MRAREKIMNTKINIRPEILPVILLLFSAWRMWGQTTSAERLTQASVLVKEGKPASAIAELKALLNSEGLDPVSSLFET
jgi:hypothetical protein